MNKLSLNKFYAAYLCYPKKNPPGKFESSKDCRDTDPSKKQAEITCIPSNGLYTAVVSDFEVSSARYTYNIGLIMQILIMQILTR